MSGLKMFECLGDCADFDLVNGCVAGDQAEAARASQQARGQAQGQGRQQQQQQQRGGTDDGEYSEGDGSEDGSQRSYSDVSITDVEEETIHRGGGQGRFSRRQKELTSRGSRHIVSRERRRRLRQIKN